MRLTPQQRQAIEDAKTAPLGCLLCDPRTTAALVRKGLAHYEAPAFASEGMPGTDQAYLNDELRLTGAYRCVV